MTPSSQTSESVEALWYCVKDSGLLLKYSKQLPLGDIRFDFLNYGVELLEVNGPISIYVDLVKNSLVEVLGSIIE